MTSQAADGPETVVASRRSKITPEREQEFFDAVLEQIRACGYDAVTMEGVAASTRCSKSTLYRQWKTKPQFVAAALRANRPGAVRRHRHRHRSPEDLRQAARTAGDWSGKDTRLLQSLGHAVTERPGTAEALREALVDPEIAALQEMLRRGVSAGRGRRGPPAWSTYRRRCSASCACGPSVRASTPTRSTWSGSWRPSCCPAARSGRPETQAAVHGMTGR